MTKYIINIFIQNRNKISNNSYPTLIQLICTSFPLFWSGVGAGCDPMTMSMNIVSSQCDCVCSVAVAFHRMPLVAAAAPLAKTNNGLFNSAPNYFIFYFYFFLPPLFGSIFSF